LPASRVADQAKRPSVIQAQEGSVRISAAGDGGVEVLDAL
jgi:hypothetical protein